MDQRLTRYRPQGARCGGVQRRYTDRERPVGCAQAQGRAGGRKSHGRSPRAVRGRGQDSGPDLLVKIDATTRFSWALLGRTPRIEHELILLYAGLIALGSDLTAADMARMTLDIEADAIGEMIRRIEGNDRPPTANRLVLDHFRTLPVTRLWGGGDQASADIMSLFTPSNARFIPARSVRGMAARPNRWPRSLPT